MRCPNIWNLLPRYSFLDLRDAVPDSMVDWMEYFFPGVYHDSDNRFDKHKEARIMYAKSNF
jgi:hypothetical protein